jgi:hypothetical protein
MLAVSLLERGHSECNSAVGFYVVVAQVLGRQPIISS